MSERHWHGEYSHDHKEGDTPHEHVSKDETIILDEMSGDSANESLTSEIEEEIADAASDNVSETMDDTMAEDIATTIADADQANIDVALRKESNELAAKALRKDAKARQEAIDATRTAIAADQPGVPVEVALSAEKKFGDSLRHKSQAQETANLALEIQSAIETPLPIIEGESGESFDDGSGSVTTLDPAFPPQEEPDENLPSDSNEKEKLYRKGGMKMGAKRYGR